LHAKDILALDSSEWDFPTQVDRLAKRPYNTDIDTKELAMQYTVITKQGKVYTFYIRAVAEMYQQTYGGQLITADVLVDTVAV